MIDYRSDTVLANIWGILFILVAILGFIPNPLVSPDGLFAVNTPHNVVHALLGVGLLFSAAIKQGAMGLIIVGGIYLVLAVLGYIAMNDMFLGLVRLNMADHYLHLVLGLATIASGFYARRV